MRQKELIMNLFGECILQEYEYYGFKYIDKPVFKVKEDDSEDKYWNIRFIWTWNGYSGHGSIDFKKNNNNTYSVCNEFGNNFSFLEVFDNSKRKQPNGRNNCSLYNDQGLETLFNRMLNNKDPF